MINKARLGAELFERIRFLLINEVSYKIEWWSNICYLHHGELQVPFEYVIQSNTWPNQAKRSLQFYDKHNEVCAILPIEY